MSPGDRITLDSAPSAGRHRRVHAFGAAHAHTVQFYEDETFLGAAVADFLADGLTAGQPVIAIATAARRETFSLRLKNKGFDLEQASRGRLLTLLDARETLSSFMVGQTPDPHRFASVVGSVIERSMQGSGSSTVRAFGEMVDLLWKDGNTDGAIRLEELWNELAGTYSVSLLCAYALGNFYKASDTERFRAICGQHVHVIPSDRYMSLDEDARLVEIALLEQRARSLEAELEHRKELEGRLREALAERRRAEQALRQSEEELKSLLAERERLLQGEHDARSEAEQANRAKSEFLAVMSHELRTPLNAIGGYVQLVEMGVHGPVTAEQRVVLGRVERSQQHLLALINDVLNLSRIEAGHVEYVLEPIPFPPMLGDAVSMIESLASVKELTCEIILPPHRDDHDEINVRADREKVSQVLLNLLTNATKFTPAGGRITVELLPCREGDSVARVEVRDTGIGIPAGKLERVFEPFVQLATPAGSLRDGVGLGLAISRDLARGMGGELTAASSEGEGAAFTLTLPRA